MWNSISKLIDPNFKSSQNNFKNNSSKNNRNRQSFDKKRNFRDKKKFFKKDDSRSSSFGDKKKYSGYTNNPNYFGKKPVENSSTINEKKDFGFKKKKKFKNRNSRPKNFTFKKHSQKRKEF
jgi:ATP-dependent RNA helicase DeaD